MRFLRARQLFDGKQFLADDVLLVLNTRNETEAIISEKEIENSRIEKLDGMLCPGFINAHCHLELSHLRHIIPERGGLVEFAKNLLQLRSKFQKEEVLELMQEADREMFRNGIVAVGDICNNNDGFKTKADSNIYYHSFIELIGLNPEAADLIFAQGMALHHELTKFALQGSLSPHAPYSVSFELLQKLAEQASAEQATICIHNQESEEEIKFLEGNPSAFESLYQFLNIDISWYKAPKISGLSYLKDAFHKNRSLLVHNTFSTQADLALGSEVNAYWCFCPNANLYIESRLPDYKIFAAAKKRICLGTDSLASNHQLSLLEEANCILKHSSVFSQEDLLGAMTSQGAEALGIASNYGNILKGKNAGLNLLQFEDNQFNFIKKIC